MAELAETTDTIRPDLAVAAQDLVGMVSALRSTCAEGDTRRTRRALRRLRTPIGDLRNEVSDLRSARGIPEVVGLPLDGLIRLVDSLRRATAARLSEQPCPELITLLSPSGSTPEALIHVRALLAPEADPESVVATLSTGGHDPVSVPLTTTQAEALGIAICGGPTTLTLQVRSRSGRLTDREQASFWCAINKVGVLGYPIETLVDVDTDPSSLRLVPVRPLRSGATYAALVTTQLRGRRGERVVASATLRTALGLQGPPTRGIEAIYNEDPSDVRNPFPSNRLRRPDGTINVPEGFAARVLPADPRLDGARAFLAALATRSEEHHGFSASVPIILRFAQPVRLEKATPDRVFLVEVGDPDEALATLVTRLRYSVGLEAKDIANVAIFTVEDLAAELEAIEIQILNRTHSPPPGIDFTDPDPADGRRFGIYRPGDPGFASFFNGTPPASVGVVARGSYLSPDYRESGRIPQRFLDGSEVPPNVPIDFLLATPPEPAPPDGFPTVILQHGFGGDNDFVTDNAVDFTAAGLAVIGIPAPEHGPRGASFLDFFVFDDFNAFGNNFRQASIDLLQLTGVLRSGIDLNGDTAPDLRRLTYGYLGVSLGGVIGATFCPTVKSFFEPFSEEPLQGCVLNVPGGKLAQFAGSISSLATPFLTHFADQADIPARTCGGAPTAPACTNASDCDPIEGCLFSDDFVRLLDAALPDFQWQLDPGDGINYIGRRLENPGGLLIQEGIGDVIVANPLTEALARAAGLPINPPSDEFARPGGATGMWRFPPPGGHGIFAQPEVRAQAITFLASRGTYLPAP